MYIEETTIIFRVNNRKYTFGSEEGAYEWVCSKVPHDGRIKKDCVPKVSQNQRKTVNVNPDKLQREAPPWYVHLLENRDFQVFENSIHISRIVIV